MTAGVELSRPLISAADIEARVQELARQIIADHQELESPLAVIVVLKGACFFAVDLLKCLDLPTRIDFLRASSYNGTGSSGEVTLHSDISLPIAGCHVLLIEDIVDSGLTASWLRRHLDGHRPESVRLCTLLDKPSGRTIPVDVDYIGFTIPDEFVLGYGLDFEEQYRNLPDIYVARAPASTP